MSPLFKQIFKSIAAVASIAALAMLFAPPRLQLRVTYVDAENREETLLLSTTEIGLLFAPKATDKEEDDVIKAFIGKGWARAVTKEGLNVFSVPHPRLLFERRMTLGTLQQAAQTSPLARAALVVRTGPNEPPFFATAEVMVGLKPESTRQQLADLGNSLGFDIVMENPFHAGDFLVRTRHGNDPFATAIRLRESGRVQFAFPNFAGGVSEHQIPPNDFQRWPHSNKGLHPTPGMEGTPDADADTQEAWGLLSNVPKPVIAILEPAGFETTHPDLFPALWVYPGWNFNGCAAAPISHTPPIKITPCGSGNLAASGDDAHGTEVAGVAAAQGNNKEGVVGACPGCRLMLLIAGKVNSQGVQIEDWDASLALDYAQSHGASVVNNSWGTDIPLPYIESSINQAGHLVVVFASGNGKGDDICRKYPDGADRGMLVRMPQVITVGGSTNQDRLLLDSSSGNCVALLAPADASQPPLTGTLAIATTDLLGPAGSSNPLAIEKDCRGGIPVSSHQDYTFCFGGTSAAAPFVAGVAALVRAARPSLTRDQVKRLLQDTADKIEPDLAVYSPATGYSTRNTHGFGRINAFEAVRIVVGPSPTGSPGGKGGVDIFLRDHELDWGNTEQPSDVKFDWDPNRLTERKLEHAASVDIKVDAVPYHTARQFNRFDSEDAVAGQPNRVYVRVRNRGPDTAASTTVAAAWSEGSGSLPEDFWSAFPNFTAAKGWVPMHAQTGLTVPYSGSSVAGSDKDQAQIVTLTFTPPRQHYGDAFVFVVVDSPQDRALPLTRPTTKPDFDPHAITYLDNNITLKRINVRP